VEIPNAKYPNQILDGQIKQAIDMQLSLKGLTRTDNEVADLYVGYQLAVNQQTQWNVYGAGPGIGVGPGGAWGWGRWSGWGGVATATATSSTINVGTLDLDIYDVTAKEQVWRGEATKTLNPSKNPEKNQKNLQKAMAKLLKNYPPKAKKK
jgi:hypothetical protein